MDLQPYFMQGMVCTHHIMFYVFLWVKANIFLFFGKGGGGAGVNFLSFVNKLQGFILSLLAGDFVAFRVI